MAASMSRSFLSIDIDAANSSLSFLVAVMIGSSVWYMFRMGSTLANRIDAWAVSWLHQNQLSGSIPAELGDLRAGQPEGQCASCAKQTTNRCAQANMGRDVSQTASVWRLP